MKFSGSLVLCAAALSASIVHAQSSIKESLVKHWKTTGEFTLAVANAMPAENYSFKPVPEEMSFGQVVVHIALADQSACANASGNSAPAVPDAIKAAMKSETGEVSKDAAVSFIGSAFDFCNTAVASLTPDKLDAVVGQSRKMSGFDWLWAYFTHTAHHRGQAEVYLRLKGIKPPQYTF